MKLIKILQDEIEKLEHAEFPFEDQYTYFNRIVQEMTINKDLSTIADGNMLMGLITLYNKEVEFETIYKLFKDKIWNKFKEHSTFEIVALIKLILNLEDLGILDEVLEMDCELSVEEISRKILKGNKDLKNKLFIANCLVKYRKQGMDVLENLDTTNQLAKLMSGYTAKIGVDFTKFAMYRDHYDVIQLRKSRVVKQLCQIDSESKEKFEILDQVLDMVTGEEIIKKFEDRNLELNKQRKLFYKDVAQKKILYNKVLEYLNKLQDDKSIDVPNDIITKLEDELFIGFIKIVLNNDRSIYTNLQIENIRKDKYNEIEKMFLQKQVNVNKFDPEVKDILIKNVKKDNLEKILYYINLPELKWIKSHPNFVQVILNTNEEILKRVTAWIKLEYVSKEIVYKNIGMLLENNYISVDEKDVLAIFEKVKNNIEALSKITELPNKIIKNSSIIFMETSKLKQSIELIKKYKLNLNSENSKNYNLDIINNIDKFDDLDLFIELGFTSYIQENPQFLRSDSKDIIARLSIMVNTGLNPYSTEDRLLGSITNGKNFFVSNELLKEFSLTKVEEQINDSNYDILNNNTRTTISKKTLELDIVRYLDNLYKENDLEYNFDGIIISRNKFLRNLECLIKNNAEGNIVFVALTHNSVLDMETIDFINKVVLEFNGKQKKK